MTAYLIFELCGIRGALPVGNVREIVRAVEISPLARAPSVVEGVIDVRGRVVPVLSLRARFNLPASPVHPSEHMILVAAEQREVAVRVDRVVALEAIPAEDITAPGTLAATGWNVAGVAQLADGLIVIHDPDAFLSATEDVALATALERDAPGGAPSRASSTAASTAATTEPVPQAR